MGSCEMICDQLNIDKNNQMTLGPSGKGNKRKKTMDTLKHGKNNLKDFNDIDEDNSLYTNHKNNINTNSLRNGANVSSKKKSNSDINVDLYEDNNLNSKDSINIYPDLSWTKITNENFSFIGYVDKKYNKKKKIWNFKMERW